MKSAESSLPDMDPTLWAYIRWEFEGCDWADMAVMLDDWMSEQDQEAYAGDYIVIERVAGSEQLIVGSDYAGDAEHRTNRSDFLELVRKLCTGKRPS